MKLKWNGVVMNNEFKSIAILFAMILLTGCDDSTYESHEETDNKKDFYTYKGFRDWGRFPVKYPYHIVFIDHPLTGNLEKVNGSNIKDPNISSECLIPEIDLISINDHFIAFHIDDRYSQLDDKWGFMLYENEKIFYFDNINELIKKIKSTLFVKKVKLNFCDIQTLYNDFSSKDNNSH